MQPKKYNSISSLRNISQWDFETVLIEGKISNLNITENNWYKLYDLYLEKIGQKAEIARKVQVYKNYINELTNLIKEPNAPKIYFKIAKKELEALQYKGDDKDTISPLIRKEYGNIDKKQISVEEYTDLILALKDNSKNVS